MKPTFLILLLVAFGASAGQRECRPPKDKPEPPTRSEPKAEPKSNRGECRVLTCKVNT